MAAIETVNDPFGEGDVAQVSLGDNLLALTLFQVRFPGAVSTLQDAIESKHLIRELADEYPYAEPQEVFQVVIQPGRTPEPHRTENRVWRLADASRTRFVTLAPDSISFYTTDYDSRSQFLKDSSWLIERIQSNCKIPAISRLGLRYTNQIEGWEKVHQLLPHMSSTVQGILPLIADSSAIGHAMSEISYGWTSGQKVIARWGMLPAGATLDAALNPSPVPSWVLDTDVYREEAVRFDSGELVRELGSLSKRAYRIFRWAILPAGLKQLGAES